MVLSPTALLCQAAVDLGLSHLDVQQERSAGEAADAPPDEDDDAPFVRGAENYRALTDSCSNFY